VAQSRGLFDREILRHALRDLDCKDESAVQVRNPVMFVVLVGSVISLIEAIAHPSTFTLVDHDLALLDRHLRHFAEAMAEGRGKAQATRCER